MIKIGKTQLEHLLQKLGSDQAVATRYGVSRQTIFNLRKKYAIPPAEKSRIRRDLLIQEKFSRGVSATELVNQYGLSLPHIYKIIRATSFKSAPQFPQQKLLTSERYHSFTQSDSFQYVKEITLNASPVTPEILEEILCSKENSMLLVKIQGENPKEIADYTALYCQLKCVDFVVGLIKE